MIDPPALIEELRRLAARPQQRLACCVAWSGGLDSTVLLHLLVRARRLAPRALRLRALHVDHHLQSASARFASHCRAVAAAWRVPLTVLDVQVPRRRGASPEEQAREARYAVLGRELNRGELLLTAQHADDQVETVLLALLRGAGPAGLSGMPAAAGFGAGQMLRPLLDLDREQLAAYARQQNLPWIDDPTNPDIRFDRNLLRLQVVPVLRRRWPALTATVARSARHCAAAAASQRRQARPDQEAASDGEDLEVAVLRRFGAARQQAALRYWLAVRGARAPDERRLQELLRMLASRPDSTPRLAWGNAEVCLSAGRLQFRHVDRAEPAQLPPASWRWDAGQPLSLADRSRLTVRIDPHGDVDLDRLPETLDVRWLQPGSARAPQQGERRLRKLFQQLQVPARLRGQVPMLHGLLKSGGRAQLLAIGDLWVHESLRAEASTRSRGRFVWRRPG